MKKVVFVLWVGVMTFNSINAQNFIWAKRLGGRTFYDRSYGIVTDVQGNVYTAGIFDSTADFDPGPATFNLTRDDYGVDVFISKLDAFGNFIWAKQIKGDVSCTDLAIDVSGNLVITGYLECGVDFDPDPSSYFVLYGGCISLTYGDIYVAKYGNSGNLIWAKKFSGILDESANAITTDYYGNVYVTGWFSSDSADFDPGPGVYNLRVAKGSVFVVKLDASGNFAWAKEFGGSGQGSSIKVDALGNVYTIGIFGGTADFDPGVGVLNLISSGGSGGHDVFITELNASGNLVWAKRVGGSGFEQARSITLDVFGNIDIIGSFQDTADFDPGPGTSNLIVAGNYDVYILQLDNSGSLNWVRSLGGVSYETASSIAADDSGNIYSTGMFLGTADFDPDTGTYNLSSVGMGDIFITKLDISGNLVWAKSVGTVSDDISSAIFINDSKNVLLTGYFENTVDFDPGFDTFNVTSAGGRDIFILKLADYNTTSLSGSILTENGLAVPGATVAISGTENGSMQTASEGKYRFNVREGGTYTITPSKSNDLVVNNGITLIDALLMRRHLLGMGALPSPYKIIAAAEVNAAGDITISTQDILFTRSLILGNITSFPTNRLWQFVSSEYVFPDTQHPFPFDKTRTYTNITTNQTNQNFIGIKLGDVNGSWDGNVH